MHYGSDALRKVPDRAQKSRISFFISFKLKLQKASSIVKLAWKLALFVIEQSVKYSNRTVATKYF